MVKHNQFPNKNTLGQPKHFLGQPLKTFHLKAQVVMAQRIQESEAQLLQSWPWLENLVNIKAELAATYNTLDEIHTRCTAHRIEARPLLMAMRQIQLQLDPEHRILNPVNKLPRKNIDIEKFDLN